jgi:hypothetical protein
MLGPVRVGTGTATARSAAVEAAWVQTAVSKEQTKNTMRLIPGLVTAEAKEVRYAGRQGAGLRLGDERFMQAVTSSPATLEGARSTFVLMNETHHWVENNPATTWP